MFLQRAPIKRIIGVARGLRNQNSLAIMSGLQPLSFKPELLDIEYMGAGISGRADGVKLRPFHFIAMYCDAFIWNASQIASN